MPPRTQARQIVSDDITRTAEGYLIAQSTLAREADALSVLEAPQWSEGRSEFRWLLLANGDLCLAVHPQGALYEKIKARLVAQRNPLIG